MECESIRFARHAFERMFERGLSPAVVTAVLDSGEIIQRYPDDRPYPSVLVLGFDGRTPVHVVVARNPDDGACVVITAYRPGLTLWNDDYRTRRSV